MVLATVKTALAGVRLAIFPARFRPSIIKFNEERTSARHLECLDFGSIRSQSRVDYKPGGVVTLIADGWQFVGVRSTAWAA